MRAEFLGLGSAAVTARVRSDRGSPAGLTCEVAPDLARSPHHMTKAHAVGPVGYCHPGCRALPSGHFGPYLGPCNIELTCQLGNKGLAHGHIGAPPSSLAYGNTGNTQNKIRCPPIEVRLCRCRCRCGRLRAACSFCAAAATTALRPCRELGREVGWEKDAGERASKRAGNPATEPCFPSCRRSESLSTTVSRQQG